MDLHFRYQTDGYASLLIYSELLILELTLRWCFELPLFSGGWRSFSGHQLLPSGLEFGIWSLRFSISQAYYFLTKLLVLTLILTFSLLGHFFEIQFLNVNPHWLFVFLGNWISCDRQASRISVVRQLAPHYLSQIPSWEALAGSHSARRVDQRGLAPILGCWLFSRPWQLISRQRWAYLKPRWRHFLHHQRPGSTLYLCRHGSHRICFLRLFSCSDHWEGSWGSSFRNAFALLLMIEDSHELVVEHTWVHMLSSPQITDNIDYSRGMSCSWLRSQVLSSRCPGCR